MSKLQPSPPQTPVGLIFTHIFGWTPGVEFEVLVSPRISGPRIRARLQPCRRGSRFDWAFSPWRSGAAAKAAAFWLWVGTHYEACLKPVPRYVAPVSSKRYGTRSLPQGERALSPG